MTEAERIAAGLSEDIRMEVKRGWRYFTIDMAVRAADVGLIDRECRLTDLGLAVRKVLESQAITAWNTRKTEHD